MYIDMKTLTETNTLKEWRLKINEIITEALPLFAVENHASPERTFGVGDVDNFGHLKVVDELNEEFDGTAVTPRAVKEVTDECLRRNTVLNKDNVASIDGELLTGDVDVTSIKAQSIEAVSLSVVNGEAETLSVVNGEVENLSVVNGEVETLSVEGDTTSKGKVFVSGGLYVNSPSNSVILENNGTTFNVLTSNSLNGEPQSVVPLSFALANEDNLSGKMTVGGDLHTNGRITADGKVYNAVWNDYAEFFERGEPTEVGDFIALDMSSSEELYVKATKENNVVVGVHSDTYGPIIGGNGDLEESERLYIPVGMVGRVMAKIDGRIETGDYVVLSDIPGVGRAYNGERDTPLDVVGVCLKGSADEGVKLLKILIR